MSIDVGKDAKRKGSVHPKHMRKVDQEPVRVPPHKKPRTYRLTVKIERHSVTTYTKEFINKTEMQAFRVRAERVIENQKRYDAAKTWTEKRAIGHHSLEYNMSMDREEDAKFKSEPLFTEELIQ